jgi:hypothetical protein
VDVTWVGDTDEPTCEPSELLTKLAKSHLTTRTRFWNPKSAFARGYPIIENLDMIFDQVKPQSDDYEESFQEDTSLRNKFGASIFAEFLLTGEEFATFEEFLAYAASLGVVFKILLPLCFLEESHYRSNAFLWKVERWNGTFVVTPSEEGGANLYDAIFTRIE